jgi:hypothetical protein
MKSLIRIKKNNTWELIPRPEDKNVIGSKWVFKNKMNEKGQVVRNKARQEKGSKRDTTRGSCSGKDSNG